MKKNFKFILTFAALLVAGCAGFFSVFGLSQLFAGASLAVIIMASTLELSKVIVVSLLQRYWTRLSRGFRNYLAAAVIVLVCITSAGIYGFLSNAYQKTASKYELSEGQQGALTSKQALFQKSIDDNKAIVATKTKRIEQLSTLRTSQEARLDAGITNADRNRARNDISSANKEIQSLNTEVDELNAKIAPLTDSVNVYANKAIELKTTASGTSEIGPLKYLAGVTGQPMDKVVNWFILLLIFVFDPLAVALVYAANKVSEIDEKEKEEKNESEEEVILPGADNIAALDPIMPVEDDRDYFIPAPSNDMSPSGLNLINPVTSELNLLAKEEPVQDEPNVEPFRLTEPEPEHIDEPAEVEEHEEEVHEEPKVEEPVIEKPKIKLEDIKEIKQTNRGFSKEIPLPNANNSIQRVGSNKHVKNNESDRLFYKKRK
jgi:hypothetical protein